MFAVLKNQIIAVDMRYKSVAKEDDKTEFRKSFEQMYDKKSGHKYNPFSDVDKGLELKNQTDKKDIWQMCVILPREFNGIRLFSLL